MAFVETSRDALKFGVTTVDNLFVTEYLPAAPDGYVRVYLYALFSAQHPALAEPTLERFAAALGMTAQQVLDAMHYCSAWALPRPETAKKRVSSF